MINDHVFDFIISAGALFVGSIATGYLSKINKSLDVLSEKMTRHDERIERMQQDITELKEAR